MFGKPEWFRMKEIGWGLQPKGWQGWGYALAWIAAMCLPFAALVARRQVSEALVWLVVALAVLVWDVWDIRKALRRSTQVDVLYIGEEDPLARFARR